MRILNNGGCQIALIISLFIMGHSPLFSQDTIPLPAPHRTGGLGLMDALNRRHSTREFDTRDLSPELMSDLLWAADGINRPDLSKRTAPSSMNYQEIDLYVCTREGVFRFEPIGHALIRIHPRDIRNLTGKQDFVAGAPLNLVFVADFKKVPEGFSEKQLKASHTNCGFIAQNVYLFCASAGLGAVVRGWFDEQEVSRALELGKDQKPILCQTIGFPK